MLYQNIIKTQIPFRLFQKFLNEIGYNSAQSYDRLFVKLDKKISEEHFDETDFNLSLGKFVYDYLIFGRKVVYSVKINSEYMPTLLSMISQSEIINQIRFENELPILPYLHTDTFPKNTFVGSFERENLKVLLFTSKREIHKRISLDLNDLRVKTSEYSEIYGVKAISYQSFDSIIIDSENNMVSFCIDNYQKLSHKLHVQFFHELKQSMITKFNLVFSEFSNLENHFPFIQQLYFSNEGTVHELGFKTDTGSIKYAEMKDITNDLRSERFHKGGTDAGVTITPFYIDINLKNEITNSIIRLVFPGHASCLNSAVPKVDHYEFIDILDVHNFLYVKAKFNQEINVQL